MNQNRSPEIKVSVSIVTYNHARYIEKAIESVLMQKADFNYEILIGEDESSDGTREITERYARQYPHLIRLFLHRRDQVVFIDGRPSGRRNFINNIRNARGKYIALLEGDDYWTDPLKLQKQADYLESHQDCSICFHWAEWLNQKTGVFREEKKGPPVIRDYYATDDLLRYNNFLATCSVMFRNGLFGEFPPWYWKVPFGDFGLHFLNAAHGRIGFIDQSMAVYRNHEDSLYGGSDPDINLRRGLKTLRQIAGEMGLKKRKAYRQGMILMQEIMFNRSREKRDRGAAALSGMKLFFSVPAGQKLEMLSKVLKKCRRILRGLKNE